MPATYSQRLLQAPSEAQALATRAYSVYWSGWAWHDTRWKGSAGGQRGPFVGMETHIDGVMCEMVHIRVESVHVGVRVVANDVLTDETKKIGSACSIKHCERSLYRA